MVVYLQLYVHMSAVNCCMHTTRGSQHLSYKYMSAVNCCMHTTREPVIYTYVSTVNCCMHTRRGRQHLLYTHMSAVNCCAHTTRARQHLLYTHMSTVSCQLLHTYYKRQVVSAIHFSTDSTCIASASCHMSINIRTFTTLKQKRLLFFFPLFL